MKTPSFYASLILTIFFLISCNPSNTSNIYTSDVGFRYQHPEAYCRRLLTDIGFKLYCPEGLMVIEFYRSISIDELSLEKQILENHDPYNLQEKSLRTKANQGDKVTIAELQIIHQSNPTLISIIPFGDDFAVIKGYLYQELFRSEFRDAFHGVTLSLEPYTP